MERRYTVDEANGLLPELSERLLRIRDSRQRVIHAGERIRKEVEADGGGSEGSDYWLALETLRADVKHLGDLGVLLRDPETGLVDFPGEVEGRSAYLCWRLGEERVGFWHDLESGFAGRRPLP